MVSSVRLVHARSRERCWTMGVCRPYQGLQGATCLIDSSCCMCVPVSYVFSQCGFLLQVWSV